MSETLKQFFYELKKYDKKNNLGEVISGLVLIGIIIMCIAVMIDGFLEFIQRVFFG